MRIRFRVHLDAPLRIGTGLPSLTADDTVVRGPSGPIIPSTTIKGAVRAAAAGVDDPPLDDRLLLRVFGRGDSGGGTALFSDALPAPGLEPVVTETTRVSLSETRTARRGRLMTHEVVLPEARRDGTLVPMVFEGSVRLRAPSTADVQAIVQGLARVEAVGAGRSRGLGNLRIAIDPAVVRQVLEVSQ